MQCRLCGGEVSPWLEMPVDAKKDTPTPFSCFVRCNACATGMLSPQPRADEIADLYRLPHYYTHGESHIRHIESTFRDKVLTKLAWWNDRSTPFDRQHHQRQFAKLLPANASVCDLGCGHGNILKAFKEMGFTVIGVDPDPTAREIAAKAGLTVLAGTAEDLPAELLGRQFDLIIMRHSLEHCIDPARALANAHALTKEGGYLYCEVPNCECAHFKALTVCSENFDSPRHLWFFTAKGLRRAIETRGYAFDSWRFDGFTRHHLPSWRAWEMAIFDRLARRGVNAGKRHTFARSVAIFARSVFAPPYAKYDAIAVVARRPSAG